MKDKDKEAKTTSEEGDSAGSDMETDEGQQGSVGTEESEPPEGEKRGAEGGEKENVDPNKGLVPLKLKLRDSAIPTENKKPRARQRPQTDTPKRKTR